MTTPAVAGHRHSEGRARFNRVAIILLVLCGLNFPFYLYFVNNAMSSGKPVSIYESYDPDVLSFKGRHARVSPEVYGRLQAYGRFTLVLGAVGFALKLILMVLNSRLPASAPPDPSDELGPIRIAGDGVAHSGGGSQWPVLLPRSQIERLELTYMPAGEKPVVLIVCGAFFILLGLPLAVGLAPKILEDFEILAAFCLFAGLAAMGVWVISLAIKKRFVLVAHTPTGGSRMMFHSAATREDVIEFATTAARRHGYPFDFGQGLVG